MNSWDDEDHDVLISSNLVHKRVGHIVVRYKHFILVWGGFMVEEAISDITVYCPPHHLWMYNCVTETWRTATTRGAVPCMNSGSTGVVLDDNLYIFGGVEEDASSLWDYSNKLYRLDLVHLVWERLRPSGVRPEPCDKAVGWAHNNRLYFFSGYGVVPRIHNSETGAKWVRDESSRSMEKGWTNQLFWYDIGSNEWCWKRPGSGAPPPRAASAACLRPGSDLALVFGGRLGLLRMNDLHCLDLSTLQWTNLSDEACICEGRSWHSFDFVESNRAIIYGGLHQSGMPSKTWWEVRFEGGSRQVSGKDRPVGWKGHRMTSPLVWHKSAFSPATNELIIVGGVSNSPYIMKLHDHVERLLIIRFQPASLFRLCIKAILKHYEVASIMAMSKSLPAVVFDVIATRLCTLMSEPPPHLSDHRY